MSTTSLDDLGKLVLRLCIGVLILFHGVAKLTHGVGSIESMMIARGLPAFLAWAVYIGEVIAPLLLVLGFYARLGGLVIMINMLVALVLVHSSQLFQLGKSGGWSLELQALFLFGGLAIALLGAGGYSLGGKNGRFN